MSDETTPKWRLDYGIHRGTLVSRDSDVSLYDSEAEARAAFQRKHAFHRGFGYSVWYAYLYAPDGTKTVLHPGTPYR